MTEMYGLMSCRGHWIPHRAATSSEPCQVDGMPVPSPQNSMSMQPRSAMRAMSSYIVGSGYVRCSHDPGVRHRPSVWLKEMSMARCILAGTARLYIGSRAPLAWRLRPPEHARLGH